MENTQPVNAEAIDLAQKAIAWMESEEGQKDLREAFRQADETAKELQAARRIPFHVWHEPMTI